ncbi:ATP-binding protein [Kribbella antibiotica]|uniref:ATP-binding protein n=1 Tax=Kribbella antibiotica TaxID=190195 RepID=A0A4R4YCJ6_9ACTN|nr:ATP-binding protein [Kribbella antibiotica]TDD42246.1 ATP-binding protein [Kribbella antibiotica]
MLIAMGSAVPSFAGPVIPPKPGPGYTLVCLKTEPVCNWILSSYTDGDGDDGSEGTPPTKGKQVKQTCQFKGAAQACSDPDLGNWSNSHQCYMRREDPQPPFSDPRWQGHTDGIVWACLREQGYDDGRHIVTEWVWLPGAPDTEVIDPLTLVNQAIASMQLAPPLVKSAPGVGQVGLVNMPVWMWVTKSENTWGPIKRSATVPGLTVNVTAQVTSIDWTMGDGKTVRCKTAGTPYAKSMGIKDSPDCGHRYTKTSSKLKDCKYPVTATAQWEITWQSTLNDSGEINQTQAAATQLRIGEAVPVLVDPEDSNVKVPEKAGCGA